MARNDKITISKTPAQITNGNITTFMIQNHSVVEELYLWASVNSAAPNYATDARVAVPPGAVLAGFTLAQLFPGVAGANRLFASAQRRDIEASFSHA